MPPEANPRDNLIGAIWMILAMGVFAVEDSLVKVAALTLPVGQIMMAFGLGGAAIFACIARGRGEPLFIRDVLSLPMRIRVGFEITGRLFYFLAVALIPLSTATVILQATPLVVVASAALVFGERVGWRRWVAILIGLAGVMVILRPGAQGFSALSVLAVIGMLGFAGRDLASRAAPASLSATILGLYGFLSVVVAGLLFSIWEGRAFVTPDAVTSVSLIAAIGAGAVAYTCLMKAMRTGDVSAVTPFRYMRLIFGVALGVVVFGERMDAAMWIGSALIVLSGLFILWRGAAERK